MGGFFPSFYFAKKVLCVCVFVGVCLYVCSSVEGERVVSHSIALFSFKENNRSLATLP